jgi:hypothetical protein
MPVALRRELAIPLCAGAFCAVVLSEPQRLMPFLTTLFAIAVVGSTLPAMLRWFGPFRRVSEGLPSRDDTSPRAGLIKTAPAHSRRISDATDARIAQAQDEADLMRMDDDGPGHTARFGGDGSTGPNQVD